MRKLLTIALLTLAGSMIFARGGMQPVQMPAPVPQTPAPQRNATRNDDRRVINTKSDLTAPVAPGDSAIFMVRNFAAQHNGTVITCDSAVRYSSMHIEFFGNVLINKNTTYIYGDRAEYDGTINEARIYSSLVKVVDGDATLYTREFRFDTKENIGQFAGGGVLTNRDNLLEAMRGYYYADTKDLVAVERVQMRNEEYELTGDSVVYNMATDNAFFFEHTNIWNRDGDYLYADRGAYEKRDTLYIITRNGYVLTEKQEMWSDSIDYYRMREHFILRHNLQLDDTEYKALAFGDYGEYRKDEGNALLTRNPAVIRYDPEQGDSLFMRSDTIILRTLNSAAEARSKAAAERADSVAKAEETARKRAEQERRAAERGEGGSQQQQQQRGSTPAERMTEAAKSDDAAPQSDSTQRRAPRNDSDTTALPDSLPIAADSTFAADTIPADTLTAAQKKALAREAARKAKEERKVADRKAREAKLDSIGRMRRDKAAAKLLEQKQREEARLQTLRDKAEARLATRRARAEAKGKRFKGDSSKLIELENRLRRNNSDRDSLMRLLAEEWVADSMEMVAPPADTAVVDSVAVVPDSITRRIKGFHHVRMYRNDFQSVCDSIVIIAADSTIHLYIEPVLWNEQNQITSDVMDVYTANGQIEHAEFVGTPMMASQLDTAYYNQIAGKEMVALFRDNAIYRNNVKGNVRTVYYEQDGNPPQVTTVAFIESGDASFDIEENNIVMITYRSSPTWYITPVDNVPESRKQRLEGFEWQGERRPAREDVFKGRIRPSQREKTGDLRHPEFPLQRQIEEQRERLIKSRRWKDRMDLVDPATVDWMRTLGYEPGSPHPQRR